MATDAVTLENSAAAAQYPALSDRDVLLCLAGFYCAQAGLTVNQAMTTAAQQGYGKLSDYDLDECYLALIS